MQIDPSRLRPARVPFKTVLASIVGLWLCYFILSTLRAELLDLGFAWEMMVRRAASSVAGIVITLGLWLVLRLFDDRPLRAKIAAALAFSVPVALSIAQANYLIFLDMRDRVAARQGPATAPRAPPAPGDHEDILVDVPDLAPDAQPPVIDGRISLVELTFSRYYLMLAWCALYLALLTGEKARSAERREGEFRRAAKAAELRSLRYQVNPHFLFNTLNSLSALVLTGRTQDAERMIQTLSTFYRHSLTDDPTGDVSLASEFRMQRLYLDIEAVRFPRRLRAVYDLPEALEQVQIPGMILQPLVENSVRHAVSTTACPVTVTLAAREEYGRLVVTVADDGSGPAAGGGKRHGHNIGLANVRERLEARFGNEASMVSGASATGYATILRIPIVRSGSVGDEHTQGRGSKPSGRRNLAHDDRR